MRKNYFKFIVKLIAIIITIFIILFIIYGIKSNIFSSNNDLIQFVKRYGIIAPILFIFIQIIQVVFPIIPGGASCLAGVLAFGGVYGFIYNYVGLCLGSIINFFIERSGGMRIINYFLKKDSFNRYLSYIKSNKFNKVFVWGIVLPGAPDDLLCYIAGLSNMSFLYFLVTILLCLL